MKQKDVRKIIRNYKRINMYSDCMYNALYKNPFCIEILKLNGLMFEERKLRRIISYIDVYNSIFALELKKLEAPERIIITEVFKKGRKIYKVCAENFISEITAYRILKKFEQMFFSDVLKSSRIVKPLLLLCDIKYKPEPDEAFMKN